MNIPLNAYYRLYQGAQSLAAHFLPWRSAVTVSGVGAISRIPGIFRGAGVSRPLVVTGPHIMKSGLTSRVTALLESAGIPYALFCDVEANPSTDTVETIVALYNTSRCDGVLAIGGGSPMDAAKAACARIARPDKTLDRLGGLLKVRRTVPPFIAVPTTAGTGSETTIAAVITDKATHRKYAISDLELIPRYAVLDPELTRELPPFVTATTGMDALVHAIEAYLCVTNNTRETVALEEEAVRDIFRYLERACEDGNDMEARAAMLEASFKAGYAFTRAGVGNIHAIAHTLGGLYNTPHGLANAVLLPVVLADYGKKIERKLARLARITKLSACTCDADAAEAFIAGVRAMNARMGIPDGFDFIKEADIPVMTSYALREANPTYPVPVIYDKSRCERVIRRVMK